MFRGRDRLFHFTKGWMGVMPLFINVMGKKGL